MATLRAEELGFVARERQWGLALAQDFAIIPDGESEIVIACGLISLRGDF